jgi:hypothetical protein
MLGLAFMVTTTPAQAQSHAAGTWTGTFVTDGPSGSMKLILKMDGDRWKVETMLDAEGAPPPGEVREVVVEEESFSFAQIFGEYDVLFRGTFNGDAIEGTIEAYQGGSMVGSGVFDLKRQP